MTCAKCGSEREAGKRCRSCHNAQATKWRTANRAVGREWSKKNYRKNREKCLAEMAAYRQANPDKIQQLSKAYSSANKNSLAEKNRAWYENNAEYAKAKAKEWRAAHPEQVRATLSDLRAKRKMADGRHTASDIKSLKVAQGGICLGCGADLDLGYHVDHIMPLSKGGTNWPSNLQLLCCTCNRKKGRKLPEEWKALARNQ